MVVYSDPATYYLLPTTYHLLPTTDYLLPTTYYLLLLLLLLLLPPPLPTVQPTTYYVLPTTYYLLLLLLILLPPPLPTVGGEGGGVRLSKNPRGETNRRLKPTQAMLTKTIHKTRRQAGGFTGARQQELHRHQV